MTRHTLDDLLQLMTRLRDPETGCPWDLRQNFATIAPYTVEEAHEVADAIERGDMAGLRDELGDLLFQVVFHARLAREQGLFGFADVVDGLVGKMLRRHPHVFPDGRVDGGRVACTEHRIDDIKQHWEATKRAEKTAAGEPVSSAVAGVPARLPALVRAQKIQKKAARVGFDWPDQAGVRGKLHEEVAELDAALVAGDREHAGEEIGDALFTLVNLARHLELDAEQLARAANRKFERRFQALEQMLAARGVAVAQADAAVLDAAWNAVKVAGDKA